MLTCHDGHEVNELYCKISFRCDCGNSTMPESCQLNNEKEYENIKNKYSRNYYDLYCHCNLPHNQELIDQQKVSENFVIKFWYLFHRFIWFNASLVRTGIITLIWTLWSQVVILMKSICSFVDLASRKKDLDLKKFSCVIKNIFILQFRSMLRKFMMKMESRSRRSWKNKKCQKMIQRLKKSAFKKMSQT